MSREWTVMLYMAGDNNLDYEGIKDLREIKRVGSTDEVAILAQFDRAPTHLPTHRYFLQHRSVHRNISQDIVDTLPMESNTGSPEELTAFIKWGMQQFPADKYMVILWGHGTGANDVDIWYRSAPRIRLNNRRHGILRPTLRDISATMRHRLATAPPPSNGGVLTDFSIEATSVFRAITDSETISTVRTDFSIEARLVDPTRITNPEQPRNPRDFTINPRLVGIAEELEVDIPIALAAIAPDDSDEDFLDNVELKDALNNVGQQIDVLGMDACLMSMAEVCYQVRESTRFLVAAEAEQALEGWPYEQFLQRLVDDPDMTPRQLATAIVKEYDSMYEGLQGQTATLSATDLPKHDDLARNIDRLTHQLLDKYDLIKDQILSARYSAWENDIADSVDLAHFCRLLRNKVQNATVKTACKDLFDFVEDKFVFQNSKIGWDVRKTKGLGIYFPLSDLSRLYGRLDMVQSDVTRWGELITRVAADVENANDTDDTDDT
jgi:hypothetical protein